MKLNLAVILLACTLAFGCSKSGVESPGKFTKEYADYLRQTAPGFKVEVVKDLELKATGSGDSEFSMFLDNAYNAYKLDPNSKEEVFKKYAAAGLDAISQQKSEDLDRSRIVGVVKDKAWLDEMRQAAAAQGSHKPLDIAHDDLNSDLIVLYAEDTPKNLKYLRPDELEKAHLKSDELRPLAVENLKRIIPRISQIGTNGFYAFDAGGDYEASLLLIDSIWPGIQKEVKGEIVVAIPARDLLLVTGSADQEGIKQIKESAKKAWSESSYRLTTKLFVYRSGKFVEFSSN